MKFKRRAPNIYVATDHPHFHFHLYYVIVALLLLGIASMFAPATETWKPSETSRMIGLIFLILCIMTTLYWLISYFAYKNIYFFNLDKAEFNWEKRRWFKKEGSSAHIAQCFLLIDVDSYQFNDIILQIDKEKIYVTSGDGKLKKRFYDWFWDCIKTAKNLHHPTESINWVFLKYFNKSVYWNLNYGMS
jgi:hypothetical protein